MRRVRTFSGSEKDRRHGAQEAGYRTDKVDEPPKPDPGLPQPPGGWSTDPAMEEAQRIAYGHAWMDHQPDFTGMTQPQLANLVHDMMTGNPKTDPDLHTGTTASGSTVMYKNGYIVFYDAKNPDSGAVFKPDGGYDYFLRTISPGGVPDAPRGGGGGADGARGGGVGTAPAPPPAAPRAEPAPEEAPVSRPGIPGGPQLIAPGHSHEHEYYDPILGPLGDGGEHHAQDEQ